MKFFVSILLNLLLAFMVSLYTVLPWFSFLITIFLVSILIQQSLVSAFLSGGLSICLLWMLAAVFPVLDSLHNIVMQVSLWFPSGNAPILLLAASLLGGITAGIVSLCGSLITMWIAPQPFSDFVPDGGKQVAVAVVAIDDDLNIMFVGEYSDLTSGLNWELPQTFCWHPNKSKEAARVLLGEMGLIAKKWRDILHTYQYDYSGSDTNYQMAYLVTDLSELQFTTVSPLTDKIKKIHINQVMQMLSDGDFANGLTVIALQKVVLQHKKK